MFELGAGEGEYLDLFKGFGCTTAGIENSIDLVSICQEKGHDVVAGFLGDEDSEYYFKKRNSTVLSLLTLLNICPTQKLIF